MIAIFTEATRFLIPTKDAIWSMIIVYTTSRDSARSYLELTISSASVRARACRKRPVPSMGEVFALVIQENG
jgi:hypothetical protein